MIFKKANLKAIDKVSYLSSEFVDKLKEKHKGLCDNDEWNWIKLLKKATDHFWKTYNAGIEHHKLFLDEEMKSWASFEALGKNIPKRFEKEIKLEKL